MPLCEIIFNSICEALNGIQIQVIDLPQDSKDLPENTQERPKSNSREVSGSILKTKPNMGVNPI